MRGRQVSLWKEPFTFRSGNVTQRSPLRDIINLKNFLFGQTAISLYVRELEDLIIEAIYQDVIKGKLDQKRKQLEIEYTMGRDLRPGQIDKMLEVLGAWYVLVVIFL